MVELEDLEKKTYLNAEEDVSQTQGATAMIAGEADYVEKTYKNQTKRKLESKLVMMTPKEINGEERIFTMNKTTERELAKAWGTNTAEWAGKKIHIFKSKASIDGELKDVLYAKPLEDEPVEQVNVSD